MISIFDKIYDTPDFQNLSGMAVLSGKDKFGEAFKMPLPHANTLFVGTTGSGKSTQIEKMIEQTVQEKDSIHVIFDPKGDYYKKFYREGTDYIISLFDLPDVQNQTGWNIMKEISLSAHPETAVREIAGAIFEESIKNNSSSTFFPKAAKSITIDTWLMVYRRYKDNGNFPSNYTLINKTKEFAYEQLRAESQNKRNADLRGDIELISPKSPRTAASVKSEQIETLQMFNTEGNFCRKDGDFSVIDFIRHGQGKRLFLVYDFATCYSCREIFGILINLMIKESIAITTTPNYNTYYYLDEVPILPDNIFNLKNAVNFGRSNGNYIIFGAQSLSQIYETYGEFGGNSILSGFNNSVIMKANDSLSISKLSERSGEVTKKVVSMGATRNDISSSTEKTYKIPPEAMTELDIGEAIVSIRGVDPFFIHFDK